MGAAKSGDQKAKVGDAYMECARKLGFTGPRFPLRGRTGALRGHSGSPE
jgi:hypothetical protein